MGRIHFSTLSFSDRGEQIQVTLLKLFSTSIPKSDLEKIGIFKLIDQHTLDFPKLDEEKVQTKFSFLLAKYFDDLKNNLTGNKVVYIHRHSGIPLIGNVAFGIVYRNSSLIEIKSNTSCNMNCVYCSISEGTASTKTDFVVEKDYLVEELKKLISFVAEPVEVHVGVQGEPFLYDDLLELIKDVEEIPQVQTISIDTNGTLLTKEKIDQLAAKGKVQLNMSLDAIDEKMAKRMAGVEHYNVKHVLEMITYAADKLKRVIVAPVLVPGFNEDEIEKIILWVKSLKKQPMLGIQNFLSYKTGRNPAKAMTWDKFYSFLEKLEEKHQIKLKLSKEDFNIHPTKELPKPFEVDEIVKAVIKCPDRFAHSSIAAAKGRTISIPDCEFKKDKSVKVKILRDKHNIFVGKLV